MYIDTPSRLAGALALLLWTLPAAAYIGPGAGIGFAGSLLTGLAVILVSLGAILFWPVRYMLRRRRARKAAQNDGAAE